MKHAYLLELQFLSLNPSQFKKAKIMPGKTKVGRSYPIKCQLVKNDIAFDDLWSAGLFAPNWIVLMLMNHLTITKKRHYEYHDCKMCDSQSS
jgi:hypothetical protein